MARLSIILEKAVYEEDIKEEARQAFQGNVDAQSKSGLDNTWAQILSHIELPVRHGNLILTTLCSSIPF